jgi:hypothetical protein
MFNQDPLVPELVALCLQIQFPVEMPVNFGFLAEFNHCATDNTDSADPLPLGVKARVLCPAPLAEAPMTALPLGFDALPVSGLRMHSNWPAIDETIVDQFADLLAGIGESNIGILGFVHPNAANTAAKDRGGKSLLELQRRHAKGRPKPSKPLEIEKKTIDTHETLPLLGRFQ